MYTSLSVNAAGPDYGLDIEHLTVYPSPYIVLSDKGYTKHFYVGAEKVATLLGDGGIFDNSYSINIEDKKRIAGAFAEQLSGITTGLNKMQLEIRDLTDKENQQLQYECGPYDEIDIRTRFTPNLFGDLLNNIGDDQPSSFPNDIYYTHSNHLGSASWITDKTGTPVQYIHYAPYGEFIANQRASGYDERFKFTGKERDAESGYNYHGARFLWGPIGIWLSVDPLADKNIQNSPYMYCNGNPIMLIDPMGLDTLHFNSDGTFNNRIVANGKHVGILHNEDGSSRTMKFVNQSDADRFCVEGSNEEFEMQAMGQKPLYGIHQVSAKTIYLMTARAGLVGRTQPSFLSKLFYAVLSGMQGGAADYNRLNEPFLKMGSSDGQVWAYIAEGSSYIQDSYNFGNMLWGQTMQQIGIPLGLTLLGAHGYTLIDPKYHSFDSMDDQHSIIMGYLYSIIRHF